MEQIVKTKLFHKDFLLVVIGQIISLLGNGVLRFALPLYLLEQSGSATLYGAATACAFLPMVLLSPVGGMIADRVNKRNIMVALDFTTAALALCFLLLLGRVHMVGLLVVTLMLLFAIQGAYQPAVQASIPLLTDDSHLVAANAVVNQVNALSGLLGPVAAGVLYGYWGLIPVLLAAAVCFFISAVMELFIRIPDVPYAQTKRFWQTVVADFRGSMNFLRRQKPMLWRGIGIVAGFNFVFSALLMVALPVLVTQTLGLDGKAYGLAEGLLAAGGLAGGIFAAVRGDRLQVKTSSSCLLGAALTLFPLGLSLWLSLPPMVCYGVLLASSFLAMGLATVFSVQMLAYIQMETPAQLTGKVLSWVLTLSLCAQPLGLAFYGTVFEFCATIPYLPLFGAAAAALLLAGAARNVFGRL